MLGGSPLIVGISLTFSDCNFPALSSNRSIEGLAWETNVTTAMLGGSPSIVGVSLTFSDCSFPALSSKTTLESFGLRNQCHHCDARGLPFNCRHQPHILTFAGYSESTQEDFAALQNDIDKLEFWTTTNQLQFNTSKCKYMVVSRKRAGILPPPITLKGQLRIYSNRLTISSI